MECSVMYNPCDMILGFVRTCGMPQMASSKGKPMINTQIEGIRVPFFQTKYDMVGNTGVFQGSKHTKNVKKHGFLWKTDLPMIGLLYLFFSFSRSIEQALKHGILQQTWDIYVYVLYVYIHVYTLFTPLRVGWPPTPQVYFGP